jgi:predicted dehydrogenase
MIRLGVIGAGYWGPNLIRNFARLDQCRLETVCDLDEVRLKSIKKTYPDIKTTRKPEDIYGSDLDGVVIATSAETHYQLAKAALENGKHVFLEKPLALSVQDGRELVDLADRAGLTLMVGHILLYHPAVQHLKQYVEDEELGHIRYIYTTRVNLGKVRSEENCLWSLAPHDISIILFLMDDYPARVVATGESYLRQGVFDVVFVALHFPDRSMAHVHVSWLDPHKIRKVTVVGDKKMAVFDDMESQEKIRLYDKGVELPPSVADYPENLTLRIGDISIPKVKATEPLLEECRHFLDCVEGGIPPLSDGRNGLAVLQVLDAAQRSLDRGGVPCELDRG